MSIRDRLADAGALFAAKRFDGALLNVLIAVAATSRRRFPKGTMSIDNPKEKMRDGEAFERFLGAEYGKQIGITIQSGNGRGPMTVEFRGSMMALVHIVYKYMRCELAHDAKLPEDIRLVWQQGPRGFLNAGDPANGSPLELTTHWIATFARAVEQAPENRDLFPELAPTAETKDEAR